ncbi:hypothetical protein FA95DRAFT_1573238 [Auriscalpium vulgare]|uniref:Uncharacterized protein n=1 Tax=Auriscalpium vulgare TaxID=40419 RepID=A0ACB8RQI2_9AGAM|nr:hypothetical protein FA95DRAFT_1573238 [Auriscalpium vulgare]
MPTPQNDERVNDTDTTTHPRRLRMHAKADRHIIVANEGEVWGGRQCSMFTAVVMSTLDGADNMHGANSVDTVDTAAGQDPAQHNAQVPVARIPPEILCRIFYILSSIDPSRPYGANGSEVQGSLGWLTATHVCQRWRSVALEDTSLWASNITVPFQPILPESLLGGAPHAAALRRLFVETLGPLPWTSPLLARLKSLDLKSCIDGGELRLDAPAAAPQSVVALSALRKLYLQTTVDSGARHIPAGVALPATAAFSVCWTASGLPAPVSAAASSCATRSLIRAGLRALASAYLAELVVGWDGGDGAWLETLQRADGLRSVKVAGGAAPACFLPALVALELRDIGFGVGGEWNELASGLERRAGAGCVLGRLILGGCEVDKTLVCRLRKAVRCLA